MTIIERDTLILNNLQFAKNVAGQMHHKYSFISYDELEAAAYMGLVEAASKYNLEQNDTFAGYAYPRIVGAIRDFLRELQWGSRANPLETAELYVYEEHLCQKEVRPACDEFFNKVTSNLTKTNKRVMWRYYIENKKIREIAEEMSVHESRISQILTDSRLKLQHAWQGYEYDLWAEVA